MYIKSRIGWQALTKREYLESGDYYLITGTDIDEDKHIVDLNRCFYVSKERYEMDNKIQVHEGDIIVTKDGTIGKVAMVTGLDKPATLNSHLFVLRDMSGNLDNRFFLHVLCSHVFNAFVESTKTGSTLTGLSQKTFVDFIFYVPKIEEQKKISKYLDNLDNLIVLHKKKIDLFKKYKRGIIQSIISQRVTLNNNSFWKEYLLGDILYEYDEKSSKSGAYEHVSLTKEGVVPKTERYNRDFLVMQDNKQYRVTHFNDICYNPANLKFGVICRNKYKDAIFSPIYVTFKVNDGFLPEFIELIVTDQAFIQKALKYQQGTVYERMAVKSEELVKTKCYIPNIEIQTKIAALIAKIDVLIAKEELKLNNISKYKHSLLQQMFI